MLPGNTEMSTPPSSPGQPKLKSGNWAGPTVLLLKSVFPEPGTSVWGCRNLKRALCRITLAWVDLTFTGNTACWNSYEYLHKSCFTKRASQLNWDLIRTGSLKWLNDQPHTSQSGCRTSGRLFASLVSLARLKTSIIKTLQVLDTFFIRYIYEVDIVYIAPILQMED